MRRIDIDFQQRSPAANAMGAILLALGISAVAASLWWHAEISSAAEDVEIRLTDAKRMMRRTTIRMTGSPRDTREMQQEVRAANSVIRQMTIPWDRLFGELTSSADETIALLAVQPDVQSRQVRISGEAKDLQAMLAYSRRLETGMLNGVMLTGHEIKMQDPQRPVVFLMTAGWGEQP